MATMTEKRSKSKMKFRLRQGQHIQPRPGYVPDPDRPQEPKQEDIYQARPDLNPPVYPIIESETDLAAKYNLGGNIKFELVELAPVIGENQKVWDKDHESLEEFYERMTAERDARQGRAKEALPAQVPNVGTQVAAAKAVVDAPARTVSTDARSKLRKPVDQMSLADMKQLADEMEVTYTKDVKQADLAKALKAAGVA